MDLGSKKERQTSNPHISFTHSQAQLHSAIAKSSPHLQQHRKGQAASWLEHSSFTFLLSYSAAGSSHWVSFFRRKICSHVRSSRVSSPLGISNCSCAQSSTGCSDCLLRVLFQGNTCSNSLLDRVKTTIPFLRDFATDCSSQSFFFFFFDIGVHSRASYFCFPSSSVCVAFSDLS